MSGKENLCFGKLGNVYVRIIFALHVNNSSYILILLLKLLFQLNDCNIKSPTCVVGLFNLQLGRRDNVKEERASRKRKKRKEKEKWKGQNGFYPCCAE